MAVTARMRRFEVSACFHPFAVRAVLQKDEQIFNKLTQKCLSDIGNVVPACFSNVLTANNNPGVADDNPV